jgi:hypothetical protein
MGKIEKWSKALLANLGVDGPAIWGSIDKVPGGKALGDHAVVSPDGIVSRVLIIKTGEDTFGIPISARVSCRRKICPIW